MVGEGGISPDYFLDKMTIGEVELFLTGFYSRNREGWEQTRAIAYTIAQSNSTTKICKNDLMPFPWDEHKDDIVVYTTTDEEKQRLRNLAKEMESKRNG